MARLHTPDTTDTEEERRAAGICEDCGTFYTMRISADGEAQPIGSVGTRCTCGNEDFRILSDDPELLDAVSNPATPPTD